MVEMKEFRYLQKIRKGELQLFLETVIPFINQLEDLGVECDRPHAVFLNEVQDKYAEAKTKLTDLYNKMMKTYEKVYPSSETVFIKEDVRLRNKAFTTIRKIVTFNMSNKAVASNNLVSDLSMLIRKYELIPRSSYKVSTAMTDGLISELSADKFKEVNKTLELDKNITILKETNERYKTNREIITTKKEQSFSFDGDMKKEILHAYREVEFAIKALAYTNRFEDYDEIITSINGIITDYMDTIQRRTLRNKAKHEFHPVVRNEEEPAKEPEPIQPQDD